MTDLQKNDDRIIAPALREAHSQDLGAGRSPGGGGACGLQHGQMADPGPPWRGFRRGPGPPLDIPRLPGEGLAFVSCQAHSGFATALLQAAVSPATTAAPLQRQEAIYESDDQRSPS